MSPRGPLAPRLPTRARTDVGPRPAAPALRDGGSRPQTRPTSATTALQRRARWPRRDFRHHEGKRGAAGGRPTRRAPAWEAKAAGRVARRPVSSCAHMSSASSGTTRASTDRTRRPDERTRAAPSTRSTTLEPERVGFLRHAIEGRPGNPSDRAAPVRTPSLPHHRGGTSEPTEWHGGPARRGPADREEDDRRAAGPSSWAARSPPDSARPSQTSQPSATPGAAAGA